MHASQGAVGHRDRCSEARFGASLLSDERPCRRSSEAGEKVTEAVFAEFDFCPILLRRGSAPAGRIRLPRLATGLLSRPFGNFDEATAVKSGKTFGREALRKDGARHEWRPTNHQKTNAKGGERH